MKTGRRRRNWSPDGNFLLIYIKGELTIYDMRSGGMSVVPSSKDIGGYWMDQNNILGLSQDNRKFQTFDLRTRKWTDLATVAVDKAWEVSQDRKYVYYETGGEEPKAWRLRFARSQDRDVYEHEGAQPGARFGVGRRHRCRAGWLADLYPKHRHPGNLCAECSLAEVTCALRNGAAPVYWMLL